MKRPGFSLLELMLVVAILGIVAAIVIPRISENSDDAKEKVCCTHRAQINGAIERYQMETGSWPSTDLSDIGGDTNYFPGGLPTCPVSGNAYTMNATTHRVDGHVSGHP